MKKIKVIKNIPARLPISTTVLYSFLMYYFNVDNLWWGVFITVFVIYWAISIWIVYAQEKIDLFEEKEQSDNSGQ